MAMRADAMSDPFETRSQREQRELAEARRRAAAVSVKVDRVLQRVDRFTRESRAAEDIMGVPRERG